MAIAKQAAGVAAQQLMALEVCLHCAACMPLAAAVVLSGQLPPKLSTLIMVRFEVTDCLCGKALLVPSLAPPLVPF